MNLLHAASDTRVGIMSSLANALCVAVLGFYSSATIAQDDLGQADIDAFDHSAEGPWSDLERTTLVVPRVADASIILDGSITPGE